MAFTRVVMDFRHGGNRPFRDRRELALGVNRDDARLESFAYPSISSLPSGHDIRLTNNDYQLDATARARYGSGIHRARLQPEGRVDQRPAADFTLASPREQFDAWPDERKLFPTRYSGHGGRPIYAAMARGLVRDGNDFTSRDSFRYANGIVPTSRIDGMLPSATDYLLGPQVAQLMNQFPRVDSLNVSTLVRGDIMTPSARFNKPW